MFSVLSLCHYICSQSSGLHASATHDAIGQSQVTLDPLPSSYGNPHSSLCRDPQTSDMLFTFTSPYRECLNIGPPLPNPRHVQTCSLWPRHTPLDWLAFDWKPLFTVSVHTTKRPNDFLYRYLLTAKARSNWITCYKLQISKWKWFLKKMHSGNYYLLTNQILLWSSVFLASSILLKLKLSWIRTTELQCLQLFSYLHEVLLWSEANKVGCLAMF